MDNLTAKLLVLALGGIFAYLDFDTVRRRHPGPEASDWRGALILPAWAMTAALAVNAPAFMQLTYTTNVFGGVGEEASWRLWRDQFAVLAGTGLLMELVRRALNTPLQPDDTPRMADLRVQITMFRRLLGEHLLAAAGLGVVFGILSGPALTLFLAAELAVMWGLSWVLLQRLGARRRSG